MSRIAPLVLLFAAVSCRSAAGQQPVDTQPLTVEGDIASQMVDGIDRFLLNEIDRTPHQRDWFWQPNMSDVETYNQSIADNRKRLADILGAADPRMKFDSPELVATIEHPDGLVATTDRFKAYAIRWPVLADPTATASHLSSIHGEGLLLVPDGTPIANVVAIPHCDHSPEQISGLAKGLPVESQYARRLAECGCRVIVPSLISRRMAKRNGRAEMTDREYLYRSAFELGHHIIGYEVQKVRAAIDWFERDSDNKHSAVGILGYGEGGHLALLTAALDTRVDVVAVSGAMGYEFEYWNQPLDRNVFGLFQQFGTANLGLMVMPRKLITDFTKWPEATFPGAGGAPAQLQTPPVQFVRDQLDQVANQAPPLLRAAGTSGITNVYADTELYFSRALNSFLSSLTGDQVDGALIKASLQQTGDVQVRNDLQQHITDRYTRQFEEIDRHNQALLRESPFVRKQYLSRLNLSGIDAYRKSVEAYRDEFRDDVIGSFDLPLLPFNARSRQSWETESWVGHEVMLDVLPDVFAYGVLLLPKDLKPGERRPVVVCQHGLEGRPTDAFLNDHRAYHDFAAKLCERGFITFAPQNPYIFKDRFRSLQRKANPLGKSLFSVIVPQHQQIVNWLKSQPWADGDRIGFYGLSYGGKSAMRIPALVTDYCLSICSADFNEWVRKNASTRHNFSYVWTGEYEIFEWDLGRTFNYFEMAALICPRPFMVERGHFDGVGEDEWVAYEYAKVRHLYAARLKIPERTEIEWFDGPHTINGQATFDFLHRHLNWPNPQD